MRIVKTAEDRKNEILDVAEELFASQGFEATSTNEILQRIGIARGTLYYHFKSKEEILDAMIERMEAELIAKADRIAGDKTMPLLERLTKSIMSLNVDSKIGYEVMEQVHKPQNALMHQKMQQSMLDGIVPIITKLAEEGNAQGIFHTDYPRQTVEMIMLYSNVAFDDLKEQTAEERQMRMIAFVANTERMLGAQPGSLQEAILAIFQN